MIAVIVSMFTLFYGFNNVVIDTVILQLIRLLLFDVNFVYHVAVAVIVFQCSRSVVEGDPMAIVGVAVVAVDAADFCVNNDDAYSTFVAVNVEL